MIRPLALPLSVALLLAGCGGAGDAPADTAVATNAAAPDDGYAQRIRGLAPGQRAGVFLRAVRDGKEQCQEVTDEYEVAAVQGRPAWAVTCDGTARWVIAIDASGTAIVTNASAASRLPPKAG